MAMRTYQELDTLWKDMPRSARDTGVVKLVVIRPQKGERLVPERAEISPEQGVHGDRWRLGEAPHPDTQITLLNWHVAELVAHGQPLELFGDNFVVDLDISEAALPVGTRLRMGSALVEITPTPHTGCQKYRARFGADALRWVSDEKRRSERLRGVHGRVVQAGVVAVGSSIKVIAPEEVHGA